MAVAKEIRTKIKSIQNTRKITKAMEMVAASKMRRAQEAMENTRPYAAKMLEVVQHLTNAHPEYRHPFMVERPVKRVGLIVVTTDRGLCGGLNVNLLKMALNEIRDYTAKGVEVEVCAIGAKSRGFFKRFGGNILASVTHLGDRPTYAKVRGVTNAMFKAYDEGQIDRIVLLRNEFVNSMVQRPQSRQLVPLVLERDERLGHRWDYIYEPDSRDVLDGVLRRYVAGLVLQSTVENVACEMAARRIAMKNATDNAGEIIKELKLVYNKARQAAITQEISEIVSGAAAVG